MKSRVAPNVLCLRSGDPGWAGKSPSASEVETCKPGPSNKAEPAPVIIKHLAFKWRHNHLQWGLCLVYGPCIADSTRGAVNTVSMTSFHSNIACSGVLNKLGGLRNVPSTERLLFSIKAETCSPSPSSTFNRLRLQPSGTFESYGLSRTFSNLALAYSFDTSLAYRSKTRRSGGVFCIQRLPSLLNLARGSLMPLEPLHSNII